MPITRLYPQSPIVFPSYDPSSSCKSFSLPLIKLATTLLCPSFTVTLSWLEDSKLATELDKKNFFEEVGSFC
jgi:hypothetical protein